MSSFCSSSTGEGRSAAEYTNKTNHLQRRSTVYTTHVHLDTSRTSSPDRTACMSHPTMRTICRTQTEVDQREYKRVGTLQLQEWEPQETSPKPSRGSSSSANRCSALLNIQGTESARLPVPPYRQRSVAKAERAHGSGADGRCVGSLWEAAEHGARRTRAGSGCCSPWTRESARATNATNAPVQPKSRVPDRLLGANTRVWRLLFAERPLPTNKTWDQLPLPTMYYM